MTEPAAATDLRLRPATDGDVDAIAAVLLAARDGAVRAGWMPPARHPASDMVRRVREDVLAHREVWVAELVDPDPAAVVAVMALDEVWLDDLYVTPAHAGDGIGSALIRLAQARRPQGFDLWVFEVNVAAQRFYERHGLVPVERTDGAGNVEAAPDIRYRWLGDG